jgi:hypothetical protein
MSALLAPPSTQHAPAVVVEDAALAAVRARLAGLLFADATHAQAAVLAADIADR